MSNDTGPPTRIERTREAKDYYYYPVRGFTEIEDGDWNRWIRCISNIPKRRPIYREVAFVGFALAGESLITSLVTRPQGGVSVLYFVAGVIALVVAGLCFRFDRQIEEMVSSTVESVLQDMNEVRERSPRREEVVSPEQNTV